jgi:hypothetical protein
MKSLSFLFDTDNLFLSLLPSSSYTPYYQTERPGHAVCFRIRSTWAELIFSTSSSYLLQLMNGTPK